MSLWADVGCHAIPLSRQYPLLRRLGPGQTPEGMWCSSLVLRGDLPRNCFGAAVKSPPCAHVGSLLTHSAKPSAADVLRSARDPRRDSKAEMKR